jgi:hypothetical protein
MASLQLKRISSQSLAACASLSSAAQQEIDESIVLQHMKLLQLSTGAISVSSADELPSIPYEEDISNTKEPQTSAEGLPRVPYVAATPDYHHDSKTQKMFMSIISCCKTDTLLEHVLDVLSNLERKERVMEMLVHRAMEESDPDILAHVRQCIYIVYNLAKPVCAVCQIGTAEYDHSSHGPYFARGAITRM